MLAKNLIDDILNLRNYLIADPRHSVWVIGDVHGCNKEFVTLLNKICQYDPYSMIIQLGDLIDRGPYLKEVLFAVRDYGVICCIGNHEMNFIQERYGYKNCRSNARNKTHKIFDSYDSETQEECLKIINSMNNFLLVESQTGIWTLSHAPIGHKIDTGAHCCMNNKPYGPEPMFHRSVHGHQHWNYRDIKKQIDDPEQQWYNIDSGCVYGNELIALELNTLDVLRVKSEINYTN